MTKPPELSIYEKAFVKSDKMDAVLVVDGKKLHVNKAILSFHSDYFKRLFNSDFKEKSMEEIQIEDVDFEDFATLLSLVHEDPLEITKQNAEDLLKLADRFLIRSVKRHMELFIKTSNDFTRNEKLILADKYNLENLLDHALKLYKSKESFRDFYYASHRNFSDALRSKMFEYFFDLKMSIYEKAFEKSDKTDAILVIDGKKLHVNKAILSYHSDYFNTLFNP